jgi:hypothetical protein
MACSWFNMELFVERALVVGLSVEKTAPPLPSPSSAECPGYMAATLKGS